jgi:hypothetical protein
VPVLPAWASFRRFTDRWMRVVTEFDDWPNLLEVPPSVGACVALASAPDGVAALEALAREAALEDDAGAFSSDETRWGIVWTVVDPDSGQDGEQLFGHRGAPRVRLDAPCDLLHPTCRDHGACVLRAAADHGCEAEAAVKALGLGYAISDVTWDEYGYTSALGGWLADHRVVVLVAPHLPDGPDVDRQDR